MSTRLATREKRQAQYAGSSGPENEHPPRPDSTTSEAKRARSSPARSGSMPRAAVAKKLITRADYIASRGARTPIGAARMIRSGRSGGGRLQNAHQRAQAVDQ